MAPIVQDTARNNLPYGERFVDTLNRLVDFNLADQNLPGLPGKMEIRQSVRQALGVWREQISTMIGRNAATKEIIYQTDVGQMVFLVKSIPLLRPGSKRIGQVFIFEDMAPLRQAQKLQVQIVWLQAALQEGKQLAGGLNDHLSRLILDVEAVQEETHALMRNLWSAGSSVKSIWDAVQRLLVDFRQQTDLAMHFRLGEEDSSAIDKFALYPTCIPAEAAMQLIASHGQMILAIEADGKGFNSSHIPIDGQHFGLQVMCQLVERVGGQTFNNSKPGKGRHIEVCLPLADDQIRS